MEILKRKDLNIKHYMQNQPHPTCPRCDEMNQTSYIELTNQTTTLMGFMPYMDEDGGVHDHDDNRLNISYKCSKNHTFTLTTGYGCDCGWQSDYRKEQYFG